MPPVFHAFGQNAEDVVLWRALHEIKGGRYVDVGANHPTIDSISRAFYDRGWSGITVEPTPQFARLQREERPRDFLVEAAITKQDGGQVTFHVIEGTGLSTLRRDLALAHADSGLTKHDIVVSTRTLDSLLEEAGWQSVPIHFMSIDTEGTERDVLESINLSRWRPWILVVEATSPNAAASTQGEWEHLILDSDYSFALFDGISAWFVAKEQSERLLNRLRYPACSLDNYTTWQYRQLADRATRLEQEIDTSKQREEELEASLRGLHARCTELAEANTLLRSELSALRESTSWRFTRPLRFLAGSVLGRRGVPVTENDLSGS